MKELLADIQLSKVAYLVEKMEKKNVEEKIKAYRKLEKMKITRNIGLYLIQNSTRNFNLEDNLGGISSSLIELCFKEYYPEYTKAIERVFDKLSENAQDRVLYLLTTIDNEDTITLYADLVVKYYKKRKSIPIGDLQNKPLAYPYLFPKLFKTFKFENINNNILILFSNYLNSGTVIKDDIKKNKKVITDLLMKIFEKALTFKFKTTYEGLNIPEYKELRYYLELAINIELSVSGKKTKEYLNKLLKKHDNQIKLFIIDNYFRKKQDISKINFNEIARDKASRYALYELLTIYEKTDLMPKKYLNQKLIAESDFYTNFVITSLYKSEPKDLEFYKKFTVDGFDYYAYKFKYTYLFNITTNDYLTDYISSQVGLDKYNGKEIEADFIGISGGYDPSKKTSMVVKAHNKLLASKISEKEDIDNIILELINKKDEEVLLEKIKKQKKEKQKNKKLNKEKKEKDKKLKKEQKKKEKQEKRKLKEQEKLSKKEIVSKKDKKESKFKKFLTKYNEKRTSKKEIRRQKKHEKLINEKSVDVELEEYEAPKKKYHIFAYFLLFLFAIFLGLLIYCILYIYGVGSINDGVDETIIKPVKLEDKGNFTEIRATEIFNQTEGEYFVLLYTGAATEKNKYYKYINEYTKRNYRFYFVDLKNDENKFLYENNDMGFTLSEDRLLKVRDREYEYYVDGKKNILNEMQAQIELIILQEQEAAKAAKKQKNQENQN